MASRRYQWKLGQLRTGRNNIAMIPPHHTLPSFHNTYIRIHTFVIELLMPLTPTQAFRT